MEKENHQKLVIDGNAIYEIDLECQRQKEKKEAGKIQASQIGDSHKRQRR